MMMMMMVIIIIIIMIACVAGGFLVFFCPVFLSLVQLLRGCISYFVNHK